jgi:cytochrome d ubiquinol oxidase subunit II
MFVAHGATFLSLKTSGPLADRARWVGTWMSPLAGALVLAMAISLAVTGSHGAGYLGGAVPIVLAAACGLAFGASGLLVRLGRDGLAFALSAFGIVSVSCAIFTDLFPRVMVSSGPGPSLTVWSAASANRTLIVMTIVAAIFVPFVLAYQGWTYWVFRQRLIRPAGQPSASASVPSPRQPSTPAPAPWRAQSASPRHRR